MKTTSGKSWLAGWLSGSALLLSGCVTQPANEGAALCAVPSGASRAETLARNFENASGGGVMVAAHRACWRETAENAISGIEACIALGVDMIEIDIRRTTDGHLVLMHDTTVDRTTSGSGEIGALTLGQVRELRLKQAAGGDDAALLDEGVPTLEEALEAARGRILINFDAKDEVRRAALDLAERKGMLGQVVIKSNAQSPADLKAAGADYLGRGYYMPIVKQRDQSLSAVIDGFSPLRPEAIEILYNDDAFLTEAVPTARKADARLWVNTMWDYMAPGNSDDVAIADPDAHWGALIRKGVNMFQTDRPRELLIYLQASGQHCS